MTWLGYAFGLLAAISNAGASILQREANEDESDDRRFSWGLVKDLFHKPRWFGGVGFMTASFFLQAAGLGIATLGAVEPLLVLELPITLIAARLWLDAPMDRRAYAGVFGMSAGTIALIAFLDPRHGTSSIPLHVYLVGIAITGAGIAACYAYGRATNDNRRRATVLGVGTGIAFGLTAAITKGMTEQFSNGGIVGVLTSWQLYGAILGGLLAVWMQQNAVGSQRLVFAQPGITLTDPYVSIVWGAVVFHETMRSGLWVLAAVLAAVAMALSAVVLSRAGAVHADAQSDSDDSSLVST
jgi:drug/metabolite transporter (DMT)-like permease